MLVQRSHPGNPELSDNSSMVCSGCWHSITEWFDDQPSGTVCTICAEPAASCLFIVAGTLDPWRLCRLHAVEFLNGLRTVEPKLDPETFEFPSSATAVHLSARPSN